MNAISHNSHSDNTFRKNSMLWITLFKIYKWLEFSCKRIINIVLNYNSFIQHLLYARSKALNWTMNRTKFGVCQFCEMQKQWTTQELPRTYGKRAQVWWAFLEGKVNFTAELFSESSLPEKISSKALFCFHSPGGGHGKIVRTLWPVLLFSADPNLCLPT